jgi:hypothetical protein
MVEPVDIQKEIATKSFLHGRSAATESQAAEAFATLAPYNNGDELVQILDGRTTLSILTATPQPTDHSSAEDPRGEG